jgi:hypothetical protein
MDDFCRKENMPIEGLRQRIMVDDAAAAIFI